MRFSLTCQTLCALLADLECGQRQQGKNARNNPQSDYNLGFGKTPVLQAMVEGCSIKDPSSQPAHSDLVLNLRRQGLS